jgi:hypothetical protein
VGNADGSTRNGAATVVSFVPTSVLSEGSRGGRPTSPATRRVVSRSATRVKTQAKLLPWGPWHDPDLGRPIAAPLAQCAELLGVDLATVRELATNVEPYVRTDGSKVWSVMQLERQLRPEAYARRRGGYLDRRRIRSADP